jgi:PLP dependent protein
MGESLAARLREVQDGIALAARSVGREPGEVTLVAVSKTVPVTKMLEAYELGVRNFGESRLQEALPKVPEMPADVVWHFVGRLQSNKARRVAETFHVVHSLDSAAQLREIAKATRTVDGLVEVNVSGEEQKGGVSPLALDAYLSDIAQCPNVRWRGLMAIGPLTHDPALRREAFRRLAEAGRRVGAEHLSMGMSDDYRAAIQEGATLVRIGSALFGERD